MKTIKIISDGRTALFTTKSVTLDSKEYFYSDMSNVSNDEAGSVYTFIHKGETVKLPYQAKDSKVLDAIFSQVKKISESKAAQAEKKAEPVSDNFAEDGPAKETPQSEEPAEKPSDTEESVASSPKEATDAETESAEKFADPNADTDIAASSSEEQASDKADENEKKTFKKFFSFPSKEKNEEEKTEEVKDDEKKESMSPEKLARLKKSLRNFVIILAVIIVAAVIYFIAFGTSNSPTDNNPNNTDIQQYDDIDQLIEDLQ